jgi:hypothetical protein
MRTENEVLIIEMKKLFRNMERAIQHQDGLINQFTVCTENFFSGFYDYVQNGKKAKGMSKECFESFKKSFECLKEEISNASDLSNR